MLKSIYKNSEKGRAGRGVRPCGEAGTGGVEPRPYGGYKRCGKRAVGDAGPYGGLQGARKNGRGRTPPLRRVQEVR